MCGDLRILFSPIKYEKKCKLYKAQAQNTISRRNQGKVVNIRPDQLERYERQIALIGEENQEKIMNSTVIQVGAGGLGSPLAYYLVSAGVGNLIIFEGDTIDISNLGRQILYTTDDLGLKKATILKERLKALNPDVDLIVIDESHNFRNNPARKDRTTRYERLMNEVIKTGVKILSSLICFKKDIPSILGIIQSRMTRSGCWERRMGNAS